MALVSANLASEFAKMMDPNNPAFISHPATKLDAATNFGNAYNTYALAAQDASTDLVVTTNLAGFIATLAAQLPDSTAGTAALAAAAFDAAFVQYWTGAVFAVGIPPTGIGACPNAGGTLIFSAEVSSVVVTVSAGVLQNLLLPIFSTTGSADGNAQAILIADAFHSATTSAVIVLITGLDTTPAPAGPLPITNTCGIF